MVEIIDPSPRFHRRTIPRSRHIDTSTHRQRSMPKKTAAPGLPVGGGARSARGSAPKSRSTAGQDTDAAAGRSSDERPAPAATSARARSRKKVDSSAAGSSSSEEVAPTASGADAQIVEDPASSNTVDEKLKFALKVRDSMLRDAVDAASRFTVSRTGLPRGIFAAIGRGGQVNMKTAAGIREKADALRELLELGQNGGGDEELWGNALIALSDAEARRVVGVVFPFQEWSRRIVTTVYPIFFGDPQGGELRPRPLHRAESGKRCRAQRMGSSRNQAKPRVRRTLSVGLCSRSVSTSGS